MTNDESQNNSDEAMKKRFAQYSSRAEKNSEDYINKKQDEELKKRLDEILNHKPKKDDDEDDDQNFIKKDDPKISKEEAEIKAVVDAIKQNESSIKPESNQQRNLDRETVGLE